MANITPRKNKNGEITSYRIRVSRGYDYNGKQLPPFSTEYKPQKGLTEKQIEKELRRFVDEFEEQCKYTGNINSSMKLVDFTSIYIETAKNTLSPTSLTRSKQAIRDFILPALGHLKLKDITPSHVQQFVEQLENTPKAARNGKTGESNEKLSPSTVRRDLSVLQAIFKQAMKQDLINTNPASIERLTVAKAKKPKVEIFSKQEAAQMLECLEKEDLQFQTLIQLAIFTGARRGELVALKFSDVDFEQQKITIERSAYKIKGQPIQTKPPKDNETRTVTINQSCVELLKLLKAEKISTAQRIGSQWIGGNWVFTQWNGEIMNIGTPTNQFSEFLKKIGLKHRKFHSLRHTSATLLLYAGVNIKQVQTRLGHSNIETTNKYLHYIEEADADAVKQLDIMLLPKKENKEENSIAKARMKKIDIS